MLPAMDDVRLKKAQELRKRGHMPYAASFSRTHALHEARSLKEGDGATIAGRVVLLRDMGKLTFVTLQDQSGRMQVALREEKVGKDVYKEFLSLVDLGDIIGVEGTFFTTQKGEPTILAGSWTMLTKALRQPPEKWHGVKDRETAYRKRYLELMSNRAAFDRFLLRSRFIRALREFYWAHGFIEVDLPVLVNAASGALAQPFSTHHDALDLDVYLRIALETHQKECLVGGFDRTFSIGPVFRNEGMDPSHLQEFTMCEHYAAYWDFTENIRFTEEMFKAILPVVCGSLAVKIPDREGVLRDVDFGGAWETITLREAILRECGIDFAEQKDADGLRAAMKKKGIALDVDVAPLGFGSLVDQLYKKVSRPKIVQPTFITEHPIELSPLARRNDERPTITDRFQLVVGGWEIINAYSELTDPVDQRERFESQAQAKAGGDTEAHGKDDEFVEALEYGCPPCSGWGMGIDRITALLTAQDNLKDVVLFPLMKPEGKRGEHAPSHSSASKGTKNVKSETSLLQAAAYGHLLPAAHGLLEEHTDQTKAHLLATGEAMATLARRFGGDEQTWRVAGMLHDLDWDTLDKDYEAHCGQTLADLLKTIEAPAELLADIRAHYASKYGEEYPLDSMLRKALYCVDELTGFIIAVTLVRPSKKIADVEVSSVKKKLKDKSFAAQVDRGQIRKCEELLAIPLDEFISLTLAAMQGIAQQLGL